MIINYILGVDGCKNFLYRALGCIHYSRNLLHRAWGFISFALIFSLFNVFLTCHSYAASLTLGNLLADAMESYPTITSRRAAKEAAGTELLAAKMRFLPSPTFSTQRNQVNDGVNADTGRVASTIGLTQPLFMGGGLVAGYDKTKAKLSLAEFGLIEAREEIGKRVVGFYAEWFRAHNKILALEDSVRLHQKLAGLISRRAEAGVASGVDRDLGMSRLSQAEAELEAQRSAEKNSLQNLSQIVGYAVVTRDLIGHAEDLDSVPMGPEVIEQLISKSPVVARAIYEAEAADAEARETRATGLPQVSFQAQRQYGNPYVPGAPGYDLLGVVVQFNPGGGFSSLAAANAAYGRAKAAKDLIETSKREVASQWNVEINEFHFAKIKLEALRNSVGLSRSIGDSYDRQYLVGRKSWLDLMNALREQTQTRISLIDAEASALASGKRIQIAIYGTDDFSYLKLGGKR